MPPALTILADDPVHGVPGLTDDPSEAEALLVAALDRARQIAGVGRLLLFHPPEAESRLTARALGFRMWPQQGSSPAERYSNAFSQAVDLGYDGAVIVDLCVPTMPTELVNEAVAVLGEHHGAIAGDGRGGIALLGLSEPQPTLFAGSEKPSYEEMVRRARQQRFQLVELAEHRALTATELAEFLSSAASR